MPAARKAGASDLQPAMKQVLFFIVLLLVVCELAYAGILCDSGECNADCIKNLKPGGECSFVFFCKCREINIG
ncbi:hypothetical protein M3Y99_00022700 [Aphelenchoides fujianensis]|nr:hypothetical protein M3Y99_00022700 [Aphelenchoides fujianensis]